MQSTIDLVADLGEGFGDWTMGDDPALLEMLLVNRNKNWAGWVKQRLGKPGTVFVAVGAGHLAGSDSVIEQLKKLKLKAKRIDY